MNRLLSRYYCGLLIQSDQYTYVKVVLTTEDPFTEVDASKKLLTIYFKEGDLSSSINRGDITVIDGKQSLYETEFNLRPTCNLDGVEITMSNEYELGSVQQYLVTLKLLPKSQVSLVGDSVVIAINEFGIKNLNDNSYLKLLNSSGYIFARLLGRRRMMNYPPIEFEGLTYRSDDDYVYGTPKNFAVEAPTHISYVMDEIRKKFPSINVFVSDNDRDTNKSEWLQIKTSLDQITDGYHTIVHENKRNGRYSYSNVRLDMEYSTVDLNLCLSRRNEYLHGRFLNEVRVVNFKVGNSTFACSLFWDRSSVTSERPEESTSQDSTGYRLFSFDIQAVVYMNLAEEVDRKFPTILKSILRLHMTTELDSGDSGVTIIE